MAMKEAYGLEEMPKPAEMGIAEPWQPYSSVACWYLWKPGGQEESSQSQGVRMALNSSFSRDDVIDECRDNYGDRHVGRS
jgi:hypothetical protein